MRILRNIEVPPSLKEMAYQSIKNALLSNKLKPGVIYNERGIAMELGISKTPVREALLDLSSKGFITILPRKGFKINNLTIENIRNLFEFRLVLEKAVILHIAPEITAETIKELEEINGKITLPVGPINFLKSDREFHRVLASLTKNPYFISALEGIRDLVEWIGAKVLLVNNRAEEALKEHILITEMLKRRDTNGAVKAIEEHLQTTKMRVLSQLES